MVKNRIVNMTLKFFVILSYLIYPIMYLMMLLSCRLGGVINPSIKEFHQMLQDIWNGDI